MITINLQWLALPIALFAIWHIGYILWAIPLLFDKELAPLIGLNAIVEHFPYAFGGIIVSLLTYFAFRSNG